MQAKNAHQHKSLNSAHLTGKAVFSMVFRSKRGSDVCLSQFCLSPHCFVGIVLVKKHPFLLLSVNAWDSNVSSH